MELIRIKNKLWFVVEQLDESHYILCKPLTAEHYFTSVNPKDVKVLGYA